MTATNVDIRSIVREARRRCAEYISEREAAYALRYRSGVRRHVTMWVGPSRAGKDEAAKTFYSCTPGLGAGEYIGSCSWSILPLIAVSEGAKTEQEKARVWEERHKRRAYWRAFCDEYRAEDPLALTRLTLAHGSALVGVRSRPEFDAVSKTIDFDLLRIWIRNVDVAKDPTLEINEDECDLTITNDMSSAFYEKVRRLSLSCRSTYVEV